MAAKFDISGADTFLSDLERMIPSDTNVDDALTAAAVGIARVMRRMAPVGDTGRLRDAIGVGGPRNSSRGRTVTAGIHRKDFGEGDYYPAFVEYGHGGPRPAPPHPFIRPAYDLTKDEAWEAIKAAMIQKLKEKGL